MLFLLAWVLLSFLTKLKESPGWIYGAWLEQSQGQISSLALPGSLHSAPGGNVILWEIPSPNPRAGNGIDGLESQGNPMENVTTKIHQNPGMFPSLLHRFWNVLVWNSKIPGLWGDGVGVSQKSEGWTICPAGIGIFLGFILGILILVLRSQPSPAAPQTRMEPVGFHPTENSFKVGSFLSPVCWENRKIPWEMQGKKLGRFLWCQSWGAQTRAGLRTKSPQGLELFGSLSSV